MADKPVFILLAVYDDQIQARADMQIVRDLHSQGVIGTYDAAVVYKEIDGAVTMDKWEKPTQHGAWTGVAAGAVVGILFPPSILGMAALGGVTGGIIGHFHGGMSRRDLHELGEVLDTGDALLIVIGRDKLAERLETAGLKAQKQVEKQVKMDGEELDRQLEEAEKELGKG